MNNINKVPPFKGWVIQNFPFIEADFDAITEYQLLCKVVEYLKKVIANENQLSEAMNYVLNYFDNLDVQDEIDNKLDEMAESGELTDIIAQYLQLAGVLAYNTVNDMKNATNIANGSICKTLGYYNVNDGGGAFYKVRPITNQDVINDMDIIALTDVNLVAEYIKSDTINIRQFGAKGDNINNDTINIQKSIDYAVAKGLKVYLPAGNYLIDNLEIYGNINFEGENKNKTYLFTTNNINYDSAVKISGSYTQVSNLTLVGTSDGDYDEDVHVQHGITFTTSHENYAYRLNINNIEIRFFTGSGIYQASRINGYLADSLFTNLFIRDNEGYGCYLANNSDFSITDSYFASNRFTGLYFACSNCRLLNNKYYLNGVGIYNGNNTTAQTRYDGLYVSSYGTIITNCSSQENYGDGFNIVNSQSCVISNCTSDANGILGFTTNSYNLQTHGSERIARTGSTVTNDYVGFRFNNVTRSIADGLNVLCFIDVNTYGTQMAYLYYFENEIGLNLNGVGTVANTSEYNYDFDFGTNNIVIINNRTLGKLSNIIYNLPNFTISDIVTGSSTGSFKINIPNWTRGLCLVSLSKGNSIYDLLVISCARTNNGVTVTKVSDQNNYTLSATSDGVTVNITSGGLYGATIRTIN